MDLSSCLVEFGTSSLSGPLKGSLGYCLRGEGYCSLPFTLSSPGMATSIMTTSLSLLSIKTMSGLLA